MKSIDEFATEYAQDKYMPVQTSQAVKAGANYVLEEVEKILSKLNVYKDGSDHTILYLDIKFLIEQLKNKAMKSNGAPEKLYLLPNGLISYCMNTDEDIEYVHKDAFIEKACQFLSEECDLCNYEGFDPENRTYYINYDKIIEDFRNYMKGE